ncbi:BMP family ABC transporter substrate-binding protein [Streptomyces cinnabarinus]|uniref:BMP family ABC transporter substrate-binding protein n=1 Tax=Streptomyces cinnabarinus TaxID=67287 RepID=A0ABY7KQ04_9ACTN|nr:BMP family ABC transporter substrate-binding protein [Streptomyces cinnabarinus]WAZ25670.1 BMP family ABC transporter substrate-binding protein [Streptomyces cinnabarinus]
MRRWTGVALSLVVLLTGGAACDSGARAAGGCEVGVAYGWPGRGDNWLNDLAAAGVEKARADVGLGPRQVVELSPGDEDTEDHKAERLRQLADEGCDLVVAVSGEYAGSLAMVAADFPDVRFAVADAREITGPNIANLVFATPEGSYLVGAAAALKSRTGRIGFLGGMHTRELEGFRAGYTAGALAVRPDVTVDNAWIDDGPGGFDDPERARRIATEMYTTGVDVVYQAAGLSGPGVFDAAREAGGLAVGVDVDEYRTAAPEVRDVILTSMVKRLDLAVRRTIVDSHRGDFRPGEIPFDLANNGVGYTTSGGHADDVVPRLEALKAQIVAGRIRVPAR